MRGHTATQQKFDGRRDVCREDEDLQREMLREIRALRRLFDEFAGVLLNARFPYGKPSDRWSRR